MVSKSQVAALDDGLELVVVEESEEVALRGHLSGGERVTTCGKGAYLCVRAGLTVGQGGRISPIACGSFIRLAALEVREGLSRRGSDRRRAQLDLAALAPRDPTQEDEEAKCGKANGILWVMSSSFS